MSTETIRFNNSNRQFYMTVKKRVDEYFKQNNISRYADYRMIIKSIIMLTLYLTPYFLLVTNFSSNGYVQIALCILMGFGMSGIGLAIMHDAVHGTYSKNQKVNDFMAMSMGLIGGSALNWRLQHNILHHTFTNIDGHDEDIAPLGFLRFSPHAEYRKIHRFQFIYAWFFYGLMTLMWATTKDFNQLTRYHKMGLLKTHNRNYKKEYFRLFMYKLFYWGFTIGIPMLTVDLVWWKILLGFGIMHFTCGLMLALIFQPAHVIEETDFPTPDNQSHQMADDWASHQLKTTANFAPKAWLLSWFVGGLNYQVEHHLFPTICHVHYKKIAPIVQETAKEFNLPYHSKKTFLEALSSHAKMLYDLGRQPKMAA